MKKSQTIAIIGGGATGISFMFHLIDELIKTKSTNLFEIILFEPQYIVGPGYAYQADFDCNLLNARADSMSIIHGGKEHFLHWLKENECNWRSNYPNLEISPEACLPRSLFGLYLNSMYKLILERTRKFKVTFSHIQYAVLDIIPVNLNTSYIQTTSYEKFIANNIVICIGNMTPKLIENIGGIDGYFNNPYPCIDIIKNVPSNSSICIIGTSLSAVDITLSLKESGHKGSIVCASQNGRLPSVKSKLNKPHTLQKLMINKIDEVIAKNNGLLTLDIVMELLLNEYMHVTGEPCNLEKIFNENAGMYDYLSTEIDLSSHYARIWQPILSATNLVIDYIWHKLPIEEKRKFYKFYRSKWISYRVSFPLINALKICDMLRTGQLRIFSGVHSISYNQSSRLFLVDAHNKQTGTKTIIKSDYVVNATGFSLDTSNSDSKLIQNLLKRGLAVSNEFGGFNVEYETGALINIAGNTCDNITVLGSLTNGIYFWTNAIDVNTRLAAKQAKTLVKRLSK